MSYVDGHGTTESVTSASTPTIAVTNNAPVGLPTIAGSAVEDQTLTVITTAITDADGLGGFAYQWLRDGQAVAGANGTSYRLGDADIGRVIGVTVSYLDGRGSTESLNAEPTAAVANLNDAPTGLPLIVGTLTEDQTLRVDTAGIADADGLGAFAYQWLREGVAIANATASTYTLGDADVSAAISVRVAYTDGQGGAELLTSAPSAAVANLNDAPTGLPVVHGSATRGQVLDADVSGIRDADGLGALAYQWQRDGVAIAGATGSTHLLGDVDVGAVIVVTVQYTDGRGTGESLRSAATAVVSAFNITPTGAVIIDGTPVEGVTLTADTRTVADADGLGGFTYQWLRDGVAIAGATGDSHVLANDDVGSTISLRLSWVDASGSAEQLISAPTAPVVNVNDAPVGLPLITGTPTEDQTLDAHSAGISDADGLGRFDFQWLRGGNAIGGATDASYTLGDADVGQAISVHVSYTDGHGCAEQLTSAATAPVARVNDAPTGLPLVQGQASRAYALDADVSGIRDVDGLGAFSVQWQRDGVDIAGATELRYLLTDADVGARVRVVVHYVDGQGTPESLTSAATPMVTVINNAATGAPVISGTPTEDRTLTAITTGIADADGLGYISHQWLRDGVAIAGATGASFTPGDDDVGAAIGLTVSYLDGRGSAESLTAAPTAPVANVNDAPTGPLRVIGAPIEDGTLTADAAGLADADGLGRFAFQWRRDGMAVAGATGDTYTLGDADVGHTLSVTLSYVDGHGTAEVVHSAATPAVANVNDAPTAPAGLAAQFVQAGGSGRWTADPSLFSDPDAGDPLSLSAQLADGSPLPPWLQFDAGSGLFTASPAADLLGSWAVRVTATDTTGASASAEFALAVTAPPPPAAPPVPQPEAEPAPLPTPAPAAEPMPAAAEAEVVEAAAPEPEPTEEDAVAAAPARAELPGASGDAAQSPRVEPPDPAPARAMAGGTVVEVRSSAAGSRSDALLAQGLLPQFASLSFGGSAALVHGDEWLRGFEQLQHEIQAQSELRRAAMASGVAAVGSLSVGYVIWLVRGGVLMSSMLSALPAWQMVDPLPVLAAAGAARRARQAGAGDGQPDDDVERLFDDTPDAGPAPKAHARAPTPVALAEPPAAAIQETSR